jgi:hypothetical protein
MAKRLNDRIESAIVGSPSFELRDDNVDAFIASFSEVLFRHDFYLYENKETWKENIPGPHSLLEATMLSKLELKSDYPVINLAGNVLRIRFQDKKAAEHSLDLFLASAPAFKFTKNGIYVSQGTTAESPYADRYETFFSTGKLH